ncbi:MAG: bifunctional hydroxymethylpyrimidine kinase/phosphomethylpyrimidine kinase, partial [Polaromonas sp.]|uniref:bifunctional hydroxymethylpyrimidine kinase/phosphomethylpyrimidine kinase n=1 Tax=Polaromonas sp. TaxID=1869339 RepID=UPI00273018FD
VEDIGLHAVKIGMLHAPDIVHTVAEAIDRHALDNVVLDPVMVATSGAVLIENPAIVALVQALFGRATVVTPNLDEAALLVGRSLNSEHDMEAAAHELLAMGARAVLLKGGHLKGEVVSDLLLLPNGALNWMRAPRIHSANTHGTGCTLSSAIAAHLALGAGLLEAVQAARAYVRAALEAGAKVRTGAGSGPLNHGHAPQVMRLIPLR